MNYEDMTEEELRELQQYMNAEVNALRASGKYIEAKELREEVLHVQALGDEKQRARYAVYQQIAVEAHEATLAEIAAEAADAVSIAETIIGGKG